MFELMGWGLIIVALLMVLLWVIHLRIKDAGIVDVGWAAGLVILACLYAVRGSGDVSHRLLVGLVVGFWGTRLSLFLLFNRVIGKEEDGRYRELRAKWKENPAIKFLFFFLFQAILDAVLSIPFLLVAFNPVPGIIFLEWIGLGLWFIALMGEAVADHQLKQFRAGPANKGRVCRIGLWNYSRHPNYFFEWLIWVSYFAMAVSAPYGWISIVCPLLMLYFLFKVTGIPATEEHALRSRGEEYREYQRTTSVFVPWFPKDHLRSAQEG